MRKYPFFVVIKFAGVPHYKPMLLAEASGPGFIYGEQRQYADVIIGRFIIFPKIAQSGKIAFEKWLKFGRNVIDSIALGSDGIIRNTVYFIGIYHQARPHQYQLILLIF